MKYSENGRLVFQKYTYSTMSFLQCNWLTHCELLHDFNHQLYLESVKVTKFRMALSKLRMSSHRLEIEVGRWARPSRTPLDQRKCCTCNKLEDEFHFLLECRLYNEIRKKYIKKYYWGSPNMIKLKELMTITNETMLLNVAIYGKSFQN